MVPNLVKRTVHETLGGRNYLLAKALYRIGFGYERGYGKSYQEFLNLLPSCGRLLDIGANIGVTTLFARRRRRDLKIVAFEPLPFNLDVAKRLCRIMRVRNVEFHEVALGDSIGSVDILMPVLMELPESDRSHVADEPDYPSWLDQGAKRFVVRLATIDSFQFPRVDGIKLDVENFESKVLVGATNLLNRDHPAIYCELWDTPNRRAVMSFLGELGYSCDKLNTENDFLFRLPSS